MKSRKLRSLDKSFWICVEGTDGTGKSSVARNLFEQISQLFSQKEVVFWEEFSDSPLGELIKEIISRKTFFYLGENRSYPLCETLMLLSDLVYRWEKEISDKGNLKGKIIISDRGYHSLLTYQLLRLSRTYPSCPLGIDWKNWVRSIFSPFPLPDLTLILVSDISTIKDRLEKRGDKISEDDLKFIREVQTKYLELSRDSVLGETAIIQNQGSLNLVFSSSLKIVLGKIEQKQL